MSKIPFARRDAFPTVLTHKSGISKSLIPLLGVLMQSSVGLARFVNILREKFMETNVLTCPPMFLPECRSNGGYFERPFHPEQLSLYIFSKATKYVLRKKQVFS